MPRNSAGMLRTRAEIDREPRTAQFVVERQPCSGRKYPIDPPYLVWVFLPSEPKDEYPCPTGERIYAVDYSRGVTLEGGDVLKIYADAGRRPCVCEHMGRLIE